MVCHKCGTKMRIVETRPGKNNRRYRQRRCPKCGYKIHTVEKAI